MRHNLLPPLLDREKRYKEKKYFFCQDNEQFKKETEQKKWIPTCVVTVFSCSEEIHEKN
jgi:hypothetical protein